MQWLIASNIRFAGAAGNGYSAKSDKKPSPRDCSALDDYDLSNVGFAQSLHAKANQSKGRVRHCPGWFRRPDSKGAAALAGKFAPYAPYASKALGIAGWAYMARDAIQQHFYLHEKRRTRFLRTNTKIRSQTSGAPATQNSGRTVFCGSCLCSGYPSLFWRIHSPLSKFCKPIC